MDLSSSWLLAVKQMSMTYYVHGSKREVITLNYAGMELAMYLGLLYSLLDSWHCLHFLCCHVKVSLQILRTLTPWILISNQSYFSAGLSAL